MSRAILLEQRVPNSIPNELRRINKTCACKLSLIASCAVNLPPGCRYRRGPGKGICGCKPRELPVCLLDSRTPYGCELCQEGKTCPCERMLMPRCLIRGCRDRRKGRHCECTRTSLEICPHLRYLIEVKHRDLTAPEANRKILRIVILLEARKPKGYREPRLASGGVVARVGEHAVVVMARRVHHGLSPWHPEDVRWLEDNDKHLERKRLEGAFRLACAIHAARSHQR